jgi:hypothetical protein
LGAEIAGTKPIQVVTVEILKLHCHGRSPLAWVTLPTFLYLLTPSWEKRMFFLKMARSQSLEGEVFAIMHPKRQNVHGASLKRY